MKKKKLRITIEIDPSELNWEGDPSLTTKQRIAVVVGDALAEYQSARHHGEESYVAERYKNHTGYFQEEEWKKLKVKETFLRCQMAELIRNTFVGIPIKDIEEEV